MARIPKFEACSNSLFLYRVSASITISSNTLALCDSIQNAFLRDFYYVLMRYLRPDCQDSDLSLFPSSWESLWQNNRRSFLLNCFCQESVDWHWRKLKRQIHSKHKYIERDQLPNIKATSQSLQAIIYKRDFLKTCGWNPKCMVFWYWMEITALRQYFPLVLFALKKCFTPLYFFLYFGTCSLFPEASKDHTQLPGMRNSHECDSAKRNCLVVFLEVRRFLSMGLLVDSTSVSSLPSLVTRLPQWRYWQMFMFLSYAV